MVEIEIERRAGKGLDNDMVIAQSGGVIFPIPR